MSTSYEPHSIVRLPTGSQHELHEDVSRYIWGLIAENERLREALKPLAEIPLEKFLPRKPDDPIMGWNDHYLLVRHVHEARAALKEKP